MILLVCTMLNAQYVPLGINYQAVARDNAGNELKYKDLSVRIFILSEGITEYAETHSVTTDPFGLFQLVIGQGSYYEGMVDDFTEINWGKNSHFLRVEINFGEGYISMGTMPFLAVPYALYSATSGSTGGVEDLDKDPENELQVLSLEGQILKISDGNSITLSDVVNDADADPENEIQDLQVDQNHILSISDDPTTVDLKPYLDNTDSQVLSKNGHSLSISNGNTVRIDTDSINEIQSLSVDGNTLSISQSNSVDIDSNPSNELQQLSLDGYDLSLSQGGGSVNIKPDIVAFRALKTTTSPHNPGDTITQKFDEELLDSGEGIVPDGYYDPEKGVFTVPPGGAGLYYFDLNYNFNTDQSMVIRVNNTVKETVFDGYGIGVSGVKTFSFIYMLNEGDKVRLDLVLSSGAFCGKGTFYGYRIH